MALKLCILQYLSYLLLLVTTSVSGQVIIVDADSNLPIPGVYVSSLADSTSYTSDDRGYFSIESFLVKELDDTLNFSHLAYEPFSVIKSKLRNIDTLKMQSREHPLAPVVVNPGRQPEYRVVSSCYRTYQIIDSSVILYSDGTIDYATKIKKDKYLLKRKSFRTFKDTSYFANRPSYSVDVVFEAITTPRLPEHLLPQEYFSRNNRSIHATSANTAELREDGVVIGHVQRDSANITYSFDGIVKPRIKRVLGFRMNALSHKLVLIFELADSAKVDYSFMRLENLIYFSHHSKMKIKHKREEEFKLVETIDEGFIEKVIETDNVDLDEYTNKSGVGEFSDYSHKYWLKCDCEKYVPPTDIPYGHLPEGPNLRRLDSDD